MGRGFLHGNGAVNERKVWIKAYASEEALLADAPRSQTIGVVTSTAITRWCIQPTVPGSLEGCVWVKDNSSTRSSNFIQVISGTGNPPLYVPVFPSGCMQYVSGAWETKTAYFYKGGAWVQFAEVITTYTVFDGGSTVDYTGGWSGSGSVGTTLSIINSGSSWIEERALCSNDTIDLTKYNTLCITVSSYKASGYIGVGSNTTAKGTSNYSAYVTVSSATTFEIDISSVTGSMYIKMYTDGFQSTSGTQSNGYAVSKIWME